MEILAVFFPVNKYHNKSFIQLMLSAKNVVLDFSRNIVNRGDYGRKDQA